MLVLVVIARENFDSGHFELFNFPGRWLLRPAFHAGIKPCDVIMHKVYWWGLQLTLVRVWQPTLINSRALFINFTLGSEVFCCQSFRRRRASTAWVQASAKQETPWSRVHQLRTCSNFDESFRYTRGNIQSTLVNSHTTLVLVWPGHEGCEKSHVNSRFSVNSRSRLTRTFDRRDSPKTWRFWKYLNILYLYFYFNWF